MENKKEKVNYNKVSKENKIKKELETPEVKEATPVTPEVKVTETPPKNFNGYVSSPLNLREDPKKDARILTVIPGGARVSVDPEDIVNGFYKVKYNGFDGFAMAQFITVK